MPPLMILSACVTAAVTAAAAAAVAAATTCSNAKLLSYNLLYCYFMSTEYSTLQHSQRACIALRIASSYTVLYHAVVVPVHQLLSAAVCAAQAQ
eukprot:16572-Heterococcus_DN1.PRE.1